SGRGIPVVGKTFLVGQHLLTSCKLAEPKYTAGLATIRLLGVRKVARGSSSAVISKSLLADLPELGLPRHSLGACRMRLDPQGCRLNPPHFRIERARIRELPGLAPRKSFRREPDPW